MVTLSGRCVCLETVSERFWPDCLYVSANTHINTRTKYMYTQTGPQIRNTHTHTRGGRYKRGLATSEVRDPVMTRGNYFPVDASVAPSVCVSVCACLILYIHVHFSVFCMSLIPGWCMHVFICLDVYIPVWGNVCVHRIPCGHHMYTHIYIEHNPH